VIVSFNILWSLSKKHDGYDVLIVGSGMTFVGREEIGNTLSVSLPRNGHYWRCASACIEVGAL
jgi:hypothetical protein